MTSTRMWLDNRMVAQMAKEAVAFSTAKSGSKNGQETPCTLPQGDCSTCSLVKHSLAKSIAQYLASIDSRIKAVYIYESEYPTQGRVGERSLSTGINLLIWVERKTAALDAILASLDAALKEETKRLRCPNASAECYSLDVKVVDDGEVSQKKGFGVLVNAILLRPRKIWEHPAQPETRLPLPSSR